MEICSFEKKLQMTTYGIVPGLGNSGELHWQTYFEEQGDHFIRIVQSEWDAPECTDWVETIQSFVKKCNSTDIVLIGHSLGCVTIAKWAEKYTIPIKGALLVAPSDIENPVYQFPAMGFTPIPLNRLAFKSIVVASENDPWVSMERAQFFADQWGAELINIGMGGHINAVSGHHKWDFGLNLLDRF